MNSAVSFAVLPYLKTSGRTTICGIEFRSVFDLEGLPSDVCEHVKTLSHVFYLQDGVRLNAMTFSLTTGPQDEERLRDAHGMLNYLYASPHPSGSTYLPSENASLYFLRPAQVVPHWTTLEAYGDRIVAPVGVKEPVTRPIPGYEGIRDWQFPLWLDATSKVYPPWHNAYLNVHQDLHSEVEQFLADDSNWAFRKLFHYGRSVFNEGVHDRLFLSLLWYTRSCRVASAEDEAIVALTTALESLLRIPWGPEFCSTLKTTIRTLLGPIDRLDEVIDQLYDARSETLHKGRPVSMLFTVPTKKGQPKNTHLPLLEYGRIIYRLCFRAILSSAINVAEARLAESFVSNHERLDRIVKSLTSMTDPPRQKLLAAYRPIGELQKFWRSDDSVTIDDVTQAIRNVVRTFKEANVPITPKAAALMDSILANLDARAKLLQVLEECSQLSFEVQQLPVSGRNHEESVLETALAMFLQYAASPKFKLWAYMIKPAETGK